MNSEGERLQKVLARTGFGSRRAAELLIEDGRVTVDAEVAVLGARVNPGQKIQVDGVDVVDDPSLVHLLLNKPRNVVTTADDPQGRLTVVDLVPSEPRLFSVGRLDFETTGLLIMTNDGDLAHLLTHPRFEVTKTYVAELDGVPTRADLRQWERGVELDDGVTAPANVRLLAVRGDSALVEVVVHEGRNRLIRRVADNLGYPVISLSRTKIGPIADTRLRLGEWRTLELGEVNALRAAATQREDHAG
ncbi:MAG: pseudouridine synthase [Acidimicrobiia bacterium]